ncbi:hypothetical protein NON20_02335 [Synechocystis sp. B12]|nr:hypothetical protein NON20_02335 [Synechocystis sp. B12]
MPICHRQASDSAGSLGLHPSGAHPPATAQITLSSGGNNGSQNTSSTPWWDTNKARRCGRLWCSDVFLQGSSQVTFTVGLIPNPEESSQAAAQAIENRAKQVESIFNSIYSRLISLNTVEIPEKDVQFLRSKVFDLRESRLGYHSNPSNWQGTSPAPLTPETPPPLRPKLTKTTRKAVQWSGEPLPLLSVEHPRMQFGLFLLRHRI